MVFTLGCVADPFIPVVSPVVQEVVINDHGITQEEDTFIEIRSVTCIFQ